MVESKNRPQYQTRYESGTETDAATEDDVIVETDLEDEGQLTTIRLYAANAESVRAEAITPNSDGSEDTATTKFSAAGVTEIDTGDFENPVFEVGAQVRISVKMDAAATGDIAANIRVDERTG